MSKCKFKIGDRVTIKEGLTLGKQYDGITFLWSMQPYCKKSGLVKDVSLIGTCTVNFGDIELYLTPCMLQHVNSEKIIIYREGSKVIAGNTLTNKTGVAKCSPADEFDFNIGAKLAFERLTNPEPKKMKLYSGKVVCISTSNEVFTKGKIYEVKDGRLYTNDCFTYSGFSSVDVINRSLEYYQFIELVE